MIIILQYRQLFKLSLQKNFLLINLFSIYLQFHLFVLLDFKLYHYREALYLNLFEDHHL
jgi:hypothetical protein